LAQLQTSINNAIKAIESDPKVQYCMTGREVQGMNGKKIGSRNGKDKGKEARFPDLTKQMRMIIAQAAVKAAKDNYYKKYDELNEKMLQDYALLGERMANIAGEDAKNVRREVARVACISMADATSLPKSANPPKNPFGKVMAAVAIVGAAVALPIAGPAIAAIGATTTTVGIGGITIATTAGGLGGAAAAGIIGGAGAAVAGIGLLGNAGSGDANGAENASVQKDLVGSKTLNQWNYKETVTSTFEWETMKCHRCTRAQKCSKEKNPIFGNKYCKTWANPTENCVDTQF